MSDALLREIAKLREQVDILTAERDEALREAKPDTELTLEASRWGLTPAQAEILATMIKRPIVSGRKWAEARDANKKIFDVHIFKMRQILAQRGIKIENICGVGHQLEARARARLLRGDWDFPIVVVASPPREAPPEIARLLDPIAALGVRGHVAEALALMIARGELRQEEWGAFRRRDGACGQFSLSAAIDHLRRRLAPRGIRIENPYVGAGYRVEARARARMLAGDWDFPLSVRPPSRRRRKSFEAQEART